MLPVYEAKMVRRKPDEMPAISKEELLDIIYQASLRDRAIICFLYLTGARVSEAILVKKNQLAAEERKGKKFLVIRGMLVLKRRKVKRDSKIRSVYINVEKELDFIKPIINWMDSDMCLGEYLFPSSKGEHIKREYVWKIVNKSGLFPHYLRHLRAIDLVRNYNFGGYELKRFFNWARMDTGENYVRLAHGDIMDKML